MHFKILVVFAFTLHIYLLLWKATNFSRLFTIIFYWSKATLMVYLKNLYIYTIYIYILYIYIIYIICIYIIYNIHVLSGQLSDSKHTECSNLTEIRWA